MVQLAATVVSGRGLATESCAFDIQQINNDQALTLINGSLNLISKRPLWLDADRAIFKTEWRVYWKGRLEGVPVIIHRWFATCPVHVFEIFAEDVLRERLNLKDGDNVSLAIPREVVLSDRDVLAGDKLAWYAFWWGRESQIYNRNKGYWNFLRRRLVERFSVRATQKS